MKTRGFLRIFLFGKEEKAVNIAQKSRDPNWHVCLPRSLSTYTCLPLSLCVAASSMNNLLGSVVHTRLSYCGSCQEESVKRLPWSSLNGKNIQHAKTGDIVLFFPLSSLLQLPFFPRLCASGLKHCLSILGRYCLFSPSLCSKLHFSFLSAFPG